MFGQPAAPPPRQVVSRCTLRPATPSESPANDMRHRGATAQHLLLSRDRRDAPRHQRLVERTGVPKHLGD